MRGQRATPLHRVCGKRLQLWSQHYTAEAGAYFGTMWSDESTPSFPATTTAACTLSTAPLVATGHRSKACYVEPFALNATTNHNSISEAVLAARYMYQVQYLVPGTVVATTSIIIE